MTQLELDVETPVGISYSGGGSSEWLIQAMIHGRIRRPRHVAVFIGETGEEHEWTYERIELVKEACREHGIPFYSLMDRRGSLGEHIMEGVRGEVDRVDNPPFWTQNPGGGRGKLRQKCTQIWKSRTVRRMQAAWLKSIGQKKRITSWIGFGADELGRAIKASKNNDVKWARPAFPAVSLRVPREEQHADLVRWTGSSPLFSMCVFCPFADPARLLQKTPKDIARCIEIDEAVRDGLANVGVEEPCFVSDRLIPVADLVRKLRAGQDIPEGSTAGAGCETGRCFL